MTQFRIDIVVRNSGAIQSINNVSAGLTNAAKRAGFLEVALKRAFSFLAIGTFVGQIKSLADYEQALARAAATTSATAQEFELFRSVTQELGATTRFTALQATEGLQFLAQSGFSAKQSIAVLDDSLRLAQVGLIDIGRAADIATNILFGFQAPISDITRFTDVLAKTTVSANTNMTQLGDAFKFVAPIAKGAGVSIEDAAAAIGVLSNAGLQGSIAGTGLRRVIARLERPTGKAADLLRNLGIRTDEVKVSSVGLQPALLRLAQAGLSAGDAIAIFGDRGGPAAKVLTALFPELQKLSSEFQNAAGFAAEAARRIDDNLLGSFLKVASAFEAVFLSVARGGGEGALRGVLESLASGLRTVAANGELIVNVGKNLLILLGPKALLGAFTLLTNVIRNNPLLFLATSIATVVAAVPELQEVFNEVGTILGEIFDRIQDNVLSKDFIVGIAENVDSVIALFAGLGQVIGFIFDNIKTQGDALGELLLKSMRDFTEGGLDFFFAFAVTVGKVFSGIGKDAIDIVTSSVRALSNVIAGNLEAAQAEADNVESAALRAANRVTTIGNQFRGNLIKLRATELLPTVELSDEAKIAGKQIADEFNRGFDESFSQRNIARFTEQLFGGEDADAANQAQIDRLNKVKEAVDQTAGSVAILKSSFQEAFQSLTDEEQQLFQQLDTIGQLVREVENFNAVREAGILTVQDLTIAEQELAQKILESTNTLAGGIQAAFLSLRREGENLNAFTSDAVNAFADNFTDSLVKLATTGKASFRELASSIIDDLIKITARLLAVQALGSLFGGGGSLGNIIGGFAPNLARANGGVVQPGQNVLVGERGPEIMRVGRTATIEPNPGNQQQQTAFNVQVVNVADEGSIQSAIAGGRFDEVIVNVISRNKDKVRRTIG